jgi:uncharacterized membrane protein
MIVLQLSLTFVSASTLKEVIISDTLNPDKSITETISIIIENNTDKTFSMTLPTQASNIYVNENRLETINISQVLNCTICTLKIRYTLPNLVKRESTDKYSFYRTLSTPQSPVNFKYVVYLPKGYLIENLRSTESGNIVPFPHEVLSDGESIILIWDETNPQFPKQYLVKYVGHETKETFSQSFNDLKHLSVVIFLIIMLALGFVIGFLYKNFINKNIKKPASKIPSSLLNPDEKKVLELLKKSNAHKNPINQKIIGRELNWSKSKTSGVLANLSYKKIIEKEKIGRNYNVKLIKEVE